VYGVLRVFLAWYLHLWVHTSHSKINPLVSCGMSEFTVIDRTMQVWMSILSIDLNGLSVSASVQWGLASVWLQLSWTRQWHRHKCRSENFESQRSSFLSLVEGRTIGITIARCLYYRSQSPGNYSEYNIGSISHWKQYRIHTMNTRLHQPRPDGRNSSTSGLGLPGGLPIDSTRHACIRCLIKWTQWKSFTEQWFGDLLLSLF
jgi:hypothetical protein